jgi:RimJ/RimL family protein N-acetyltransferase
MKPPEIFETERLILRRPKITDAESIFSGYARDSDVTRYLTWRTHRRIEDTIDFLKTCSDDWKQSANYTWAITATTPADDHCIGMVSMKIDSCKAELGYVLKRSSWGKGIMTEAAGAVVSWASSEPELHRVWAVCDCENPASASVLEKIGMRREGILHHWSLHPNLSPEGRDCFCYVRAD